MEDKREYDIVYGKNFETRENKLECKNKIIPEPLKKILIDLDVIAQIKKNHKINIKSKDYADATSWIDAFWRMYYREDKNSSLTHIEKTIETAIKMIENYPEFKGVIIEYLNKAKDGINIQREVYQTKPNIIASLDILMKNIEAI